MAKPRRGPSEEDFLLLLLFLIGALAVVGAMAVSVGASVLDVATDPTPTITDVPTITDAPPSCVSIVCVGSEKVEPGGTVKINVTANVKQLASYRIKIQFDSSLLMLKEMACVPPYGKCSLLDDNGDGRADGVSLSGSIFTVDGITGDDVLLSTIRFDAEFIEDTAHLTVDESTLRLIDTTGNDLPHTVTNGKITISSP